MLEKGQRDPGIISSLRVQLIWKRQRGEWWPGGDFWRPNVGAWVCQLKGKTHNFFLQITVVTKCKHLEEIQITIITYFIIKATLTTHISIFTRGGRWRRGCCVWRPCVALSFKGCYLDRERQKRGISTPEYLPRFVTSTGPWGPKPNSPRRKCRYGTKIQGVPEVYTHFNSW